MLRAFKLARHPLALDHRQRPLDIARPEVTLFGIVTAIILYLSSVGIYFFDNAAQPDVFASVFLSLWWAMVALATVGYGDAVPPTAGGRILTGFLLIFGMGIVAVPTGIIQQRSLVPGLNRRKANLPSAVALPRNQSIQWTNKVPVCWIDN
ncbi:MAG: two pore domain potassium channel family protein [Akkermansiaceae bacterium]|nr:two pore domain potassium channel family protein [Verrucomicrobiae bacterium]MCP5552101.1 two pore domain potassium channel family protein [Akkermansiaceae bacterium]